MKKVQSLILTKPERESLLKTLPDDWAKTIADKFLISTGHAKNILYGVRKNSKVLRFAIKLAATEIEKNNQSKDILNKIAS
jgi:transketolase N-terminal domain/subunit